MLKKVNIFAWRVSLDKLHSRLNLSLRGLDIPSIIFPLCSIAVESTSHLLFSCHLARQLMLKVARWWELEVHDFLSYDDWLLWLINLRVSKRFKDVFEGLMLKVARWWELEVHDFLSYDDWLLWLINLRVSKRFKDVFEGQYGGLGVNSMFALNRALLFKWVWRFLTDPEALWVRVVKAVHGMNGFNNSSLLVYSHNSIWCNIVKSIEDLKRKGIDLLVFCSKRVGNGSNTDFWNDIWFGDVTFRSKFNRIYALEDQKNVSVAEKMAQLGWTTSFRRLPRGGVEASQWEELAAILGSVVLSSAVDKWRWTKLGSGDFTVSSARSIIDEHILPSSNMQTRWSSLAPIKVNVLAWRLAINKLATKVNLYNRGLDVPSILCGVCDYGIESTDHLFFGCSLAVDLMVEVGRWWSLDIPTIGSFLGWHIWFESLSMPKAKKDCLEVVFFALWWHVWNFRNARIYALEDQKNVSVAEKMAQLGWTTSFRRLPRGGVEASQWEELAAILGSVVLSSAVDKWRWTKLGSGDFTVSSARSIIDEHILPSSNMQTRWSSLAPIKVNVLAWRLAINKLATKVNLYNRGLDVPSILCGVCDYGIESTDHLFFGCSLAVDLMVEVGRWWSLDIPTIGSFLGWHIWFESLSMPKAKKDCLEVVFFALWWHVWNFRNARLFAKKKPRKSLCMDNIVTYAFLWISGRCKKMNLNWVAWLQDLSLAISSK
ncbi:RNA-directed DNA polymerase, eukaryota, Reverse transcriptase zinc-binding domain protein [Artemisia annua]|uniref:RNA-directed DNA polymerase, eukaryota, Reverse transcriptase zinc-binding domain protein n=1 Tax=Artemisia annua TaxID=35608 RepID=A0A2U1NBB3_ARTAN|nr:RNA-directed DNA polymerase, eukaryota, Reverse transcriptase zinc-binding domain protein [Artemisia annua]